ncbi:hypothetical protein [Vibrio harveyi]
MAADEYTQVTSRRWIQSFAIDSLFTENKQGKQRNVIASSFQVV